MRAFLHTPRAIYPLAGSTVRIRATFANRLQLCRVVEQQKAITGSEPARVSGAMCRQANGQWLLKP
jgi:hypothetical protein